MWAFIARRLAAAVPVMIGITFVAFVLIHLVPGSPAKVILYGSQATPQQIANLTSQLGLDQPWWEQYARFIGQLLRGNLGTSYLTQTSVAHELLSRTPSTLILTGSAMVVAIVIGVPLGVLAGARPGSFLDRAARGVSFLGVAIPYFFLALVLLDIFAVKVHWFPLAQGYNAEVYTAGWHWGFIVNAVDHSLLPALTIVLTSVAGWMLQMRNVMITTIGEDYVIAAQAKGLSNHRVIFTYAARNALLPQLQGFGLALGFVVSGAIVMEIVFSYPGIGLLLFNAVTSNDYPLMQAIFLLITFAVLIANLIVDLIIVLFDPRVRARGSAR